MFACSTFYVHILGIVFPTTANLERERSHKDGTQNVTNGFHEELVAIEQMESRETDAIEH